MNRLYYGDNLDVLRRYVADETVDLVYLDPPFNSNASYNVLFAEQDGSRAAAQILAFEDTWQWDQVSAQSYQEVVEHGGNVSAAMQAFRTFLGESNMLAYLAMMAPRLKELRRVLRSTGSLYLHCDTTASHYLKILMDGVFGAGAFRNEIVWKRADAHSDAKQGAKHFGRIHDVILYYSKGNEPYFKQLYRPLPESTVKNWYRYVEEGTGRRYNKADLTGPGGAAKGNPHYEWKGITRYWRYTPERMEKLEAAGRIVYSKSGMAYQKRYLDESKGVALQDWWDDIEMLRGIRKRGERLGYPTQKPQSLLERIIESSCPPDGLVLDPFCGCGTTVAASQALGRRWIGIDITHLAINLIKHRLRDTYGPEIELEYEVIGEPVTVEGAEKLAADDPYQFQWWALGLVGARPVEQKKGADKGIDGRLYFHDEAAGGKTKQIILSVKAGGTGAAHVRDLRGVIERDGAEIGVLLTMQQPTAPMRKEAASAGFYESPWGKHPRLQVLTIQDLLDGKKIDYPPARQVDRTFKKAPKVQKAAETQLEFGPDSN